MECGFLSQKGSRGGRGVKEKDKVADVISPAVTDEPLVKEKQDTSVDTGSKSYPPLPTQGSTPAVNTAVVPVESIKVVSNRVNLVWLDQCLAHLSGLNAMLENGPWFIRSHPIILKKWDPNVNLLKEDVGNIPVWVKHHGVPVTAFSEDGLSVIATKLGTPIMLDSYTADMCLHSWVDNDVELGTNEGEMGTNEGTSNLDKNGANSSEYSFWNVENSSTSTTLIMDKIDKFKDLIIDRQAILVDETGNPLNKFEYPDDHDSEDEVASVDNDMARSLASKRTGFGTKILLEQWTDSYGNGDYDDDPYDDDMYEGQF
ncbi:RNA-directed DNA polymerase, eukaryota, reverse transcriptase zinc-binding domain protein [Tanacetum coccineum]|uniref:RNA-directed DNA polymerase, eukaryota, reverse transcriptase zinc-binding domain protein n=1 Tax=Tanacetum coccineum TaxID=301880 RepID=A0ABQ5FHL0_9ASTR